MGVIDDLYDKAVDKVDSLLGRQPRASAVDLPFPGMTGKGVVGPTLGEHVYVEAPPEFEASSVQVCGFWPFSVGASTALVGSVLGRHFYTGGPVCGDPMTAFKRGIISAPSAFVLALNGRGKSSMVVRMLLGIVDAGDLVMVLGRLETGLRRFQHDDRRIPVLPRPRSGRYQRPGCGSVGGAPAPAGTAQAAGGRRTHPWPPTERATWSGGDGAAGRAVREAIGNHSAVRGHHGRGG